MQITNNKYNTMPEQVQENKDNIKSILAGIKELYSTTETLTEQSETITQSLTTVPRGTKKGFLIDAEANLFNILSVVENVVYIKYMTNVKGVQGEQGVKGDKGDKGEKGDKGDAGSGFEDITDINLVVGEPNVLYDTEDGITITSQGEVITTGSTFTPTVEQNIPLIAGNGLTMDATEDGQHVDIHLSAETQSKIERALKTPISTPTSTKIIAVDNTNSQELLGIGTGLEESNGNVQVAQSLRNQVQSNSNQIGTLATETAQNTQNISNLNTTKANQSSLDTTNSNVTANTNSINSLVSKGLKLLWTNPNPSSSFSAQTITLSSSDYDYLICFYNFASDNETDRNFRMSTIALKGYSMRCLLAGRKYAGYRELEYVSNTSYSVLNGSYSDTSDAKYAVPIQIYGGKF